MNVDTVTDELYGLPPSEFTKARDASVTDARKKGDAATADALKSLRRPTSGAWIANQMVRQRRTEIDRILALADQLRDAQVRLDGAEIRRLSNEGRDAVTFAVEKAADVARDLGVDLSASSVRDLQSTLDAALADPECAAALRAGRLTSALRYSGLGLADAMAKPARPAMDPRSIASGTSSGSARAAKQLERVRAQLRDAETAVEAARSTLAERKEIARDAARRVREAEKAVREAATPTGVRTRDRR